MTQIHNLQKIKAAVDSVKAIQSIEKGFVTYSEGCVVVPPVAHLAFDRSNGDCHIKCGYV